MRIALLAGDGIGPEITAEAVKILKAVVGQEIEFDEALIGGAAWKVTGSPLPEETLKLCKNSDAILFGSVGDPECDHLERALRPEQAILGLRKELDLFANLRPARLFPELQAESPLKENIVTGTDLMIVRELTGDVYFGTPRGQRKDDQNRREGFDTMRYNEDEVKRIARIGFETARSRSGNLCSIDKSNVLETSQLWRTVVLEIAQEYPDVELSHMYVDNAAMQLVRAPDQFDVIVTGNLFGDILSDLASACVGSIGLLPSASLNSEGKGLYEPIHGSAPDIAGLGKANPLATILSGAMMLRYSLKREADADRIEKAVSTALEKGARTADLGGKMTTSEMGNAVLAALN
ncbi:3-isopropylmalate dehydrogenase [Zymomonas mobilis subsp. mobilis ZM4 = ATCC 31821]|uniref:3-isopropylmalate dehydrogenase n=1 Tax=Zymomonas mobilis subsp. mobilis (strain ATCC 31821 / ZM4 / CP4) TaxID=264203 RepID=LEU3_ZYMMO|nr:3-isopropylmalate dehydrogenase [Zymomonas mobilis]Q5NPQ9.1 RecName: Full=3-isopropylmalate dehydrogenase; AltName: Full=3-IPM-DH; AltName: Full=Beta-IPM dehydrogenase; Short=IMDH [Zymomonas mobilis subsp. mobilis ZM4 = ATCC 31821]AAV89301.1 3-isopropylmalate dehydrogenase [Zymomonas mobilis subsp. mobilis ZM4 = ATCC 31821]ACV75137.1 3-isopropylmalate dehydrogenase [Zymomonas mobilis subsp. mobilis NCIMB 11163]AHB09925.1 3-isopropylmalate dehydrogenase [Zymomonas mobilis subsp. mobilis str. 